jgi:hypothetical protein
MCDGTLARTIALLIHGNLLFLDWGVSKSSPSAKPIELPRLDRRMLPLIWRNFTPLVKQLVP